MVEHGMAVSALPSPYTGLLTRPTKVWEERCPDMLESGKAVFQGYFLTPLQRTIHLSTPEQLTTFSLHSPSGTRRYSYYEQ